MNPQWTVACITATRTYECHNENECHYASAIKLASRSAGRMIEEADAGKTRTSPPSIRLPPHQRTVVSSVNNRDTLKPALLNAYHQRALSYRLPG